MKIDLRNIQTINQLHLLFKQQLNFPEFYGMNWDAFWDSITGLVEMPENLILEGWDDFAIRFPKDSQILSDIIIDFNCEASNSRITTA